MVVYQPEPQPLRIPAASIDTLWIRGYSTKMGSPVGALLGGGTMAGGLAWAKIMMVLSALVALVLGSPLTTPAAQTCGEPYRVSRQEIYQAMSAHGPYSLTSTTTSMLFGSEALLALVRRRQREAPESTQFLLSHDDWFAAHLATAKVPYAQMSASARAGFEHRQDVLVDYGPPVVEQVVEGPTPITSLDVTMFSPDTGSAPAEFNYRDTLSVPKVDVFNHRVVRFKMLEYDGMLVFDRVTGISVRPIGFLSALFAVLGKPDLKETRVAVSADHWQVVRGRVKVFPGISKTGTATIEPDGRGHEGVPPGRADLGALRERLRQPIELRYGPPSCQARVRMQRQRDDCRGVMGGAGMCANPSPGAR